MTVEVNNHKDIAPIVELRQIVLSDCPVVHHLLNITLILQFQDVLFVCVYFRMQQWIWIDPFTIQIVPRQITPVVSVNYTIRIEHWHNFPYVHLSQFYGLSMIR